MQFLSPVTTTELETERIIFYHNENIYKGRQGMQILIIQYIKGEKLHHGTEEGQGLRGRRRRGERTQQE